MRLTRRQALQAGAITMAAPFTYRVHAAAPSETVLHASFGAAGMAQSDMNGMIGHKNWTLVAVADVDATKFEGKGFADIKKKFPKVKLYKDWRELLAKEKNLDSVNVSTPDHMHAPMAMSALNRGLAVYCQKPLTHTLHEARRLAEVATEKNLVTQMGIQMHSHHAHQTAIKLAKDGTVGRISAVHCWMGKGWGDPAPLPSRKDVPPATLDWNGWLGVAAERPYLGNSYYHPENWRKRLDFGGGTLGDMACHILDPVFAGLGLEAPQSVTCTEGGVVGANWGLDNRVEWMFPGNKLTTETLKVTWCDGVLKPPQENFSKLKDVKLSGAGSLYVGEKGMIFSPSYSTPTLLPKEDFKAVVSEPNGNHWHEFIDAVRGKGTTSTPFSFSGRLTETVLLGCLSQRFLKQKLTWFAKSRRTDSADANKFLAKTYRNGWEVEGF